MALATQPAVRLADLFGNPVTTNGTTITAALASGSGTLGGTLTALTVSGVATFTNLAVTGPTGTYTIRFTSGSLTPDTSTVITIGAGVASTLAMTTQPSASAQNGVAFAQQPSGPGAGRGRQPGFRGAAGDRGHQQRRRRARRHHTVNTEASGLATFAGLSVTGTVGARTLVFSSGA